MEVIQKMKRTVKTRSAPTAAGPYSQAVIYGDIIFVSGQLPIDPKTGTILEGGIEVQAVRCLENIKAILYAAGSSPENLLKITVFLSDMKNFDSFNDVYKCMFLKSPPAGSCVEVSSLPMGAMIEIDAVAAYIH